jgi:hypothetical protein
VIRPYILFNGIGEYLGSFADWESAHKWAHELVDLGDSTLPIEIEDRAQRVTRRITPHSCDLVAWTVFTKIQGCVVSESAPRIPPYLPE